MHDDAQAFVTDPSLPAHAGPYGLFYDFNDGCRVFLPPGQWRLQLRDLDTDTVLFDAPCEGGQFNSAKHYYIRFGLEIWREGASVLRHDYDATAQNVFVQIELGGIGDHLAWFDHVAAFQQIHACHLTVRLRPIIRDLLQGAYPHIRMITTSDADTTLYYATYKICIFYNDHNHLWQPCDYRVVGFLHSAPYILGLPPVERRPQIAEISEERPIAERYVCIAAQASGQSKYWNNPDGWPAVIGFLKRHGYRVICIDLQAPSDPALRMAQNLTGVEDQTGNRPLSERATWLKHAAFFVGLSSGLAWLAWAVGTPVVMISGFTHPINEFATPYRIINWNICNSCSNDIRLQLDPSDYEWCPRHKNTPRMFECTRLIMAAQVTAIIGTIPGFSDVTPRGEGAEADMLPTLKDREHVRTDKGQG